MIDLDELIEEAESWVAHTKPSVVGAILRDMISALESVRAERDAEIAAKWEVQYGRRNRETGALHWLKGDPLDSWWHENQDRYEHVKRYTSPPLPVGGESNGA